MPHILKQPDRRLNGLATRWLAAACLALAVPSLTLQAQTQSEADSILNEDQEAMASFVFSENQMDETEATATNVNSLATYNEDPYLSNVGYLFSAMWFRVRGYDSQYQGNYINGVLMNDAENGRFGYSRIIGGLNDATRNQQGIMSFEQNTIGYMDLGGGANIDMRASGYAAGSKATLSLTNRNYKVRAMFTHATGLNHGWAFAASAGIRYSDEGVIEGTYYRAASIFLGASRVFNNQHQLSLDFLMAPTKRAAQAASTEEAYWLANSHYYNPNWGYQNGKKRNARVTTTCEPTALLTWDFKIDDKTKLTTTAVYRYGWYGSTRLERMSNATATQPDYYTKMPSNAFNVYSDVPTEWQLEKWQTLYDYWTSSKANRQIQWDQLYYINQQSVANGGEAVYYLEEYHNDQRVWGLSSTLNHIFDKHNRIDAGIQLNSTKGMHYKTMEDLLGANYHTDIDHYSVSDYGKYSYVVQNNLDNPNRKIYEGDKFEYDYDINVNKLQGWLTYTYTGNHLSLVVAGDLRGQTIERYGHYLNGRSLYYDSDGNVVKSSKGSSGTAKFLGGGGKFSLGWSPSGNHKFTLSAGYELRPPIANNAFVAARIKNDFVEGLTNEKIFSADASYRFVLGQFSGKVSGYVTRFTDQVEQTAFYDDLEQRYTYLTMTGVDKIHYGVELALNYDITPNLAVNFLGTVSEAQYTNNPKATLTYDNASDVTTYDSDHDMDLRVIADGMRVDGTPLTALSLGIDYNINNWFFGANLNYYDRVYVSFSEYRRLTKSLTAYSPTVDANGDYVYGVNASTLRNRGGLLLDTDGNLVEAYSPHQEKYDGGFMLDLSIGKYIRFKGGKSMSINLSVQNVTNNTNLRTGGYEQNRDDKYSTGEERPYVFSRNSKYYYANAINAFLNINYRF